MSKIIIAGEDLHKNYGSTKALRGANLEVKQGEILAIMGASGSGKSTLLHVLSGIIKPTKGTVQFNDQRIDRAPDRVRTALRRTKFGFVFQFSQLVPELTALDNVAVPLLLAGVRRREAYTRAAGWLKQMGVGDKGDALATELSGGQAQRVAIARAIVLNPKYLFCDEPNSGLDPKTSLVIDELLSGITKEFGITTIINTHDMNSVMEIGDHITFIYKGKVEWTGNKADVVNSDNKRLNDLVFASDLFKKVKQAENE